MESNIYTKDYLVSRLITMNKEVPGYSKVYYQANENLVDYLDTDFYDKDVFSVLASSDQVFTARFLDAKTVDSFDFNRLTLYYYYLRVWSIKYANELYPLVLNGNKWLNHLLHLVKPSSEQEQRALEFFKQHIKDHSNLYNLFYNIEAQPEGKVLYSKPEELKGCIEQPLEFFHLDMFKQIELERTYDILLLSNILDWARNDQSKLRIVKENIDRLLRPNGIVICSNLVNRNLSPEKEIFSEYSFNQTGRTYTYTKR